MRPIQFVLTLSLLFAATGCSFSGVPLLGLDDRGNFVEKYASPDRFTSELHNAASQVGESTFNALKDSPPDQSGMLRTVVVGLGFNLSAGLFDFWTIGVSPKVRFAFSNSKNPIVP